MADIIRYTGGETITATVGNMVSSNADAYWYTGSKSPTGASYIINGIYDDNNSSTSTDFAYKTDLARVTGNNLTNSFKTAANIFDDTNKRYPKYVVSFIKLRPKYASGNYGNEVQSTNYVEVRQKVNSVSITSSNNKTYGNAAFTISYTVAPSNAYVGNVVSFSKQSGSSVNLSGTANKTVTIVGAGTSTIKYTSADGKCTGTFNIVVAKATPTITMADTTFTFTGSRQYMTATVNVSGTIYETYNGSEPSTTNYNSKYTVTANTSFNIDSATNVGNWTIKALFVPTDTNNYNNASKSNTLKMNARNLSDVTVTWGTTTFDYNGSTRTVTPTLKYGSITLVSGTDYTVSNNSRTSAGSQTVTVTGKGNYTGTKTTTLTVNKAASSMTNPGPKSVTYGGRTTTVTISCTNCSVASATSSGSAITVSSSGNTLTLTSNSISNAGSTATITVTGTGNTNYNDPSIITFTASIVKATPSYTAPSNNAPTYTGSNVQIIKAGSTSHGTLYYNTSASDTGQTTDVSASALMAISAGSYTRYWKLVGDANHNNIGWTAITCTIGKRTSTITAPTGRTVNYNGSAQALANAGSCTGGKIQYSLASGGTYSDSIPTGTNYTSGTTVYWKAVLTNSNYVLPSSGTSGSVTGKINKVTALLTTPSAKSGLIYTGSIQVLINAGSSSHGTFYYNTTNSDTGQTTDASSSALGATNAGSYTRYWKLVGDANHNNIGWTAITCTIGKRTSTVKAPTGRTVTYNGSAQALANAGSCTGGKIQYCLTSNGTYSNSIPTATNYTAGTTVYWKAVLTDSNYALPSSGISGSITGILNARNLSDVTVNWGTTTFDYDGVYKMVTPTLKYGSMTLKIETDYTITGRYRTDAGTTTVTVTGTGNYTGTLTTTLTVNKVAAVKTNPKAKSGLVYTGSPQQLINAGSSNHGTFYYGTGSSGSDATTDASAASLKASSAKSHIRYWKFVADHNHTGDVSWTSITCPISKASSSMANPGAKSVPYGSSAAVTISCANCSVSSASSSSPSAVTVTRSSNTNTLLLTSIGNAGSSATITVTGTGSTNYNNPSNITFTATVAKADQAAPTAEATNSTYPYEAYASAWGGGGHGSLAWTNGYILGTVGYLDTAAYWTGDSNYNRSPNSNTVRIIVSNPPGSYYPGNSYYG